MSLRSRHTKSTTNGPIASCRTNLNPASRRSRKANHSLRSASVCEPRSLRSILTFLRLGPRIAPHPARSFAARHPLPVSRGEGTRGSHAPRLLFLHREIAQHAIEALLIFVVLLPAAEVADVTRTQLRGPRLVRLHHGIVEADGEEDDLAALMFFLKRAGHFFLDPIAFDRL